MNEDPAARASTGLNRMLRRLEDDAAPPVFPATAGQPSAVTLADLAPIFDLVARVDRDRPSTSDLLELESALAAHPGVWRTVVDLASRAIDNMLDQLHPTPAVRLALHRGAEELRSALAGGSAGTGGSPLESALAEQAAVCWVRLRIFETWLVNATDTGDPVTIKFWEARVSSAQGRYLAALESLARIRRLAVRTPQLFQINVAGQQINVARTESDQE